jgi:hypothetical protein
MTEGVEEITLKKVTNADENHWDSLVESSPQGTVFHTWAWVSAMAKHSRISLFGETIKPVFHPLIAENHGKAIGIMPLYEFPGRFVNYIFSPPPHTAVTYLGPCLKIPDNMKQGNHERLQRGFQNAIEEYIAKIGANCIRIRPPPKFNDARPYLWLGYEVTPLYNYVLDLQRPIEEIFQQSEPSFRNKVRRTEKEGYTVREGSFKDLEKLYMQQKARYEEQGKQIEIELEYLQDLWMNMPPGRLRMLIVEKRGEHVTATIEAYYKGRVYGWIGNPKSQSVRGSPNDLLIWEVIKYAVSNGYMEYENIWANDERLNPFKTKLNPHINRYYSVVRMSRPLSMAYQIKKSIFGRGIWSA